MRRPILIFYACLFISQVVWSQCTCSYTYTVKSDTVTFTNTSSVSNAHYFWSFGDGTGSNAVNPVHVFPDNGRYIVTLFAHDTVGGCATYYEERIDVVKDSGNSCQPWIGDSIFNYSGTDYLEVYDSSMNCNTYNVLFSGANFDNLPPGNWVALGGGGAHFHIVCLADYRDTNSIVQRLALKTIYYQYSSSHNYGDSSANFEFVPVSTDSSGERILFTAMNKTATFYKWQITGFGNPIYSSNDTISHYYPYSLNIVWQVQLITQDFAGYIDTITQNITAFSPYKQVTGLESLNIKAAGLNIYPNPSNGLFTLDLGTEELGATVEIYNMLDQNIMNEQLKGKRTTIDLSNYADGLYFCRVISAQSKLLGERKLIIRN